MKSVVRRAKTIFRSSQLIILFSALPFECNCDKTKKDTCAEVQTSGAFSIFPSCFSLFAFFQHTQCSRRASFVVVNCIVDINRRLLIL